MKKHAKSAKIQEIRVKGTLPRIFILFLQTAHAIEKFADRDLYFKAGLSLPKLALLWILEANGGTMIPSAIAVNMLVEKHSVTPLVDRLKRDGLGGV